MRKRCEYLGVGRKEKGGMRKRMTVQEREEELMEESPH